MSLASVEKKLRAVVLGASAGGINALGYIFSELGEDFSLPILVTKHVGLNDDRGTAIPDESLIPTAATGTEEV